MQFEKKGKLEIVCRRPPLPLSVSVLLMCYCVCDSINLAIQMMYFHCFVFKMMHKYKKLNVYVELKSLFCLQSCATSAVHPVATIRDFITDYNGENMPLLDRCPSSNLGVN